MQAVCIQVVTSSSVASTQTFWGTIFWLETGSSTLFGTLPVNAKIDKAGQKFWGQGFLSPIATPMVTRNERKRKCLQYWMFNLSLTKNSQQRKTNKHCRTPLKSNIVSSGSYVWLLPTRLSTNIDCLLNPYIVFKSAQVFLKENVRHPVWTCRDPLSLIVGTRFSLILRTRW